MANIATASTAPRRRQKAVAAAPSAPAFYRPANWSPENSVAYYMRRTVNLVTEAVDHELAPAGLTSAQWIPLLKLYMGHASTVAELARVCTHDVGAMTRTLDRLEAKGLIRRVRSIEDRRVVNLELTEEGRAQAKKIPAALCRVQNAHLRGFSEEEWHLLKGMLGRILDTALELQREREGNPKQ
jgi:DNA-binding MarR family transcriptional regulator